jgi:hypothetical protein
MIVGAGREAARDFPLDGDSGRLFMDLEGRPDQPNRLANSPTHAP